MMLGSGWRAQPLLPEPRALDGSRPAFSEFPAEPLQILGAHWTAATRAVQGVGFPHLLPALLARRLVGDYCNSRRDRGRTHQSGKIHSQKSRLVPGIGSHSSVHQTRKPSGDSDGSNLLVTVPQMWEGELATAITLRYAQGGLEQVTCS